MQFGLGLHDARHITQGPFKDDVAEQPQRVLSLVLSDRRDVTI